MPKSAAPKRSAKPAAKPVARAVKPARATQPKVVKKAAKVAPRLAVKRPGAGKSAATVRKPTPAGTAKPADKSAAAAKSNQSGKRTKPAKVVPPSKPSAAKPVVTASRRAPAKASAPVVKAVAAPVRPPSQPVAKPTPVIVIAAVSPPPEPPKRAAAKLGARDLQHFADLLLQKRREIVGDMHGMEGEALRSGGQGLSNLPVHMADMGTDNYEQEFTLTLVEKDRQLLREINHALAKIPAGTYGICEGTGEPIGKARLEQVPWARHGIEYARQKERNGRGVRMFS